MSKNGVTKIKYNADDFRTLAMEHLEPYIVFEASETTIYGYDGDDIAQELRMKLWKVVPQHRVENSVLRTFAQTVMRNFLIDLDRKMTGRQKRKDHLCEPIHKIRDTEIVYCIDDQKE